MRGTQFILGVHKRFVTFAADFVDNSCGDWVSEDNTLALVTVVRDSAVSQVLGD